MNTLVCIKRVPSPGMRIVLTEDKQEIETRNLGFTISPHEECAIEEAIRMKEKFGGTVTVLSLGSESSSEQLRYAMAMGADNAVLLKTEGKEWGPMATAGAIADAIADMKFNLILMGNESADSGGYQVGIRVAHQLGWPCATGIKSIDINEKLMTLKKEISGGFEIYELPLPAVVTVKEGINLPRYPSLPGRMKAKRKTIDIFTPTKIVGDIETLQFDTPRQTGSNTEILGKGVEVAPKVVDILDELGLLKRPT